jgi:class 3 adenylate cyclase
MDCWNRVVEEKRRSTLFAAWLGIALYAAFGVLDSYIFPDVAHALLPVRLIVIGYLLALAAIIAWRPALYLRHSQPFLSGAIVFAGLGIVWMNAMLAGQPNGAAYYAGLVLVIACTFVFLPIRFRLAVAVCALLVVSYNVMLAFYPVHLPVAVSNDFFLLGSAVICGRSCLDTERLIVLSYEHQAVIEAQKREVEEQKRRADDLLHHLLPDPIAQRLLGGTSTIADGFADVTVLFADLAGFTEFSSSVSPRNLVRILNRIFAEFDDVAQACGVEKIKTIGDAYMAACGVPEEVDDHPERIINMAIGMRRAMARIRGEFPDFELDVRIGVHTGPCVAGVIGRQRCIYDLWGDTVNLASRMESSGINSRIQVSEATYLRTRHVFRYEPRGEIPIKGRGLMKAFLLQEPDADPRARITDDVARRQAYPYDALPDTSRADTDDLPT